MLISLEHMSHDNTMQQFHISLLMDDFNYSYSIQEDRIHGFVIDLLSSGNLIIQEE